MPFPPEERKVLLSVNKGVGPTVLARRTSALADTRNKQEIEAPSAAGIHLDSLPCPQ